jgi:hypothetical protein
MDLLSAVLACSLHADPNAVAAIAMAYGHGNPYAVIDANAAEDEYDGMVADDRPVERLISSVDEGLAAATRISEQGGAPLVGLLPIPPAWAAVFQRPVAELFDPCINIAIASAMLSNFEYECGGRASRRCVLRKYGEAVGLPLFAETVSAELSSRRLRVLVNDAESHAHEAQIFVGVPNKQRSWGPDRIFFGAAVAAKSGQGAVSPSKNTPAAADVGVPSHNAPTGQRRRLIDR